MEASKSKRSAMVEHEDELNNWEQQVAWYFERTVKMWAT
jgi:hypothetical protein